MKSNIIFSVMMVMATIALLCACSKVAEPVSPLRGSGHGVMADDIPVAHTPPGGYGNSFPPPILAKCTEPLVEGAPDLRGIWKAIQVERGIEKVPVSDRLYNYVERIEQCGNRIVDMGGGTIADGRADGTAANGIHDVLVFDYKTPLHVIVSYEEGTTYVLSPMLVSVLARKLPWVNIPWSWLPVRMPWIKITRRLSAQGHMVWSRPDQGFVMTLERIGGPNDPYTRRDLPDSTTGGSGLLLAN
jgi:hypothetical protein